MGASADPLGCAAIVVDGEEGESGDEVAHDRKQILSGRRRHVQRVSI